MRALVPGTQRTRRRPDGTGRGLPVSEEVLRQAWAWAEGRCECKRDGHGHADRCGAELAWERQGGSGVGSWEVRLRQPPVFGGTEPENCEIVCRLCSELGALAVGD